MSFISFSLRPAASAALSVLLFQAAAAHARGQDQAGIEKALEGLPPEVRQSVRLQPDGMDLPSASADDPLSLAVRAASLVSGDTETQNRLLHDCGRQAVRQGRTATARELAARLTDYRAALLLLEIAEKEAGKDRGQARGLVMLAAGMTGMIKPWQAELVLARLVHAGALLELEGDVTRVWWESIRDPETRFASGAALMTLESAKTGVFDLARLRSGQDAKTRGKPVPALLEVSRRLFGQALERLASTDARQQALGTALVESGIEVLAISNVPKAEVLVETAVGFFQAGHEDLARRIFSVVEDRLAAPHEEQARLMWHVARLWALRGRASDMPPLLAETEAAVRRMDGMHHPFAFAWLAAALELAGEKDKAAALLDEAVTSAAENPNRRTGLAGAVEISLCHARTGRVLPENVNKKLAEMAGLPAAAGE
ncbi:MAG TPA: hypothetical protein DIT13_09460 [Verrucomicrobiales bacterium]|nr:hypothetical protein [Verrucomicrobiales bacterium]HRK12710.1 hypothetical protein [Prosthecobacter sp.]